MQILPPPVRVDWMSSDLLLKNRVWKEKKSNSGGEKPGKHYLSQVVQVNTTNEVIWMSCRYYIPDTKSLSFISSKEILSKNAQP